MSHELRLNELVQEHVRRERQGEPATPEELCRDCPELVEQLRARLAQLTSIALKSSPSPSAGGTEIGAAPPGSAPGVSAQAVEAVRRYGRYRINRFHASGGIGEVYLAEDEELRRCVAVKKLRPKHLENKVVRQRFVREAEITARLEHPGIVPIYGMVHGADGQPSYAMRYIEGESLLAALDRYHIPGEKTPPRNRESAETERHLAFRQMLQNFIALCNTVAFAHSHGVIHRDLKPSNVMLGKFGETLLLDWGLAKSLEEADGESTQTPKEDSPGPNIPTSHALTEYGFAIGTPEFMSPEQAMGGAVGVGPASDIYSLGTTLYLLLTGQSPFAGPDSQLVMLRVRAGKFQPPRAVNSGVPPALEAICLKAMARNPLDRYVTAADLADDVAHWLADEPVAAYREPRTDRMRRWTRRHRTLATGVLAALVVMAISLGIGTLLLSRANDELHSANRRVLQANAQLVMANERETAERQRAQDNERRAIANQERAEVAFGKAKEAVERFFVMVTENAELKNANSQALRKEFLEAATPFFQWFTEQKPGDAALEAERGRAHHRLALVRNEIGEKAAAAADYERAQAVFQKLANTAPALPVYRLELAISQGNLGNTLRDLGRRGEAEAILRAGLEVASKLVAEFPTDPGSRRQLAFIHNSLGSLLKDLGNNEEAASAYSKAMTLRQELAADFPGVPDYRHELAGCYINLGLLNANLKKYTEAEAAYHQALEILQELASSFPKTAGYRRDLATVENNLGNIFSVQGRLKDAEAPYAKAVNVREKLLADYPTVQIYRTDLAGSYVNSGNRAMDNDAAQSSLPWYDKAVALLEPLVAQESRLVTERLFLRNAYRGRARAFFKLRLYAESVADWDRALAVNAISADEPRMRASRALALVGAHDHAKAVSEANAVAEVKDVSGAILYDLARVCAVAAAVVTSDAKLADQYAARAVALLRQAVTKGYKDIEHLKKDEDFNALREREDYKKLVKELGSAQSQKP